MKHKRKATVSPTPSGSWGVYIDNILHSEHNTNQQAWRAIDKLSGEPVNNKQDTSDWSFTRLGN